MKSKKVVIAITLSIVVLVAILVFIVFSQSSKTPTNNQSQSASSTGTAVSENAISYTEVGLHNSRQDCWTVINGKVYDITEYINSHPGGNEILRACGIDGTTLFTTRTTQDGQKIDGGGSHSANASRQLANYQIGILQQ